MIKRYAAAALLLAAVPAGAGVATTHEAATAAGSTHTLHLRLHVTAGHSLDKHHFVGTERVRSRDTHAFVGFDSFRGHIRPRTFAGETAFAFRGGMLLIRTHSKGESPVRYVGHVIGGTGAYDGATGTARGRGLSQEDTLFTIRWTR